MNPCYLNSALFDLAERQIKKKWLTINVTLMYKQCKLTNRKNISVFNCSMINNVGYYINSLNTFNEI